jgi:AmiR/NasT family two-component response regulator
MTIALNTYSKRPDPWQESALVAIDGYAQLAAAAVRLQLQTASLEESIAGLYSALETAEIVERAVGAIMQCNRCSADEARELITSTCHERNVTERDVAETLLTALTSPGSIGPIPTP